MDFSQGMKPLVVYNNNSSAEKGWKIKNGKLLISDSGNYAPNIHSTATIFAKVQDATTVNFRASNNTEENYDYLTVFVVSGGEEASFRISLSGPIDSKDYSLELAQYKGKEIEIRFQFTSDGNTESTGPVIEMIEIK